MFDRLVKSHLEAVHLKLAVGGEGEQLVLRVQLPAHLAAVIVTMRMASKVLVVEVMVIAVKMQILRLCLITVKSGSFPPAPL